MYTGSFEFIASIGSVEFEEYEITSCPVSGLDKVVFRAASGSFVANCSVHMTELNSIEYLVEEIKSFCEASIDELCVYLDDPVESLELYDYNIVDAYGESVHNIIKKVASVRSSWSIFGIKTVGPVDIRLFIGEPSEEKALFCKLYRSCMNTNDNVHKYMMLYHVLLIKCFDRQGQVDSLIKRLRSDVSCSTYIRNGKIVCETVFTRLRNEIAHRRTGSCYETTCREINDKIKEFSLIVRDAIVSRDCCGSDSE